MLFEIKGMAKCCLCRLRYHLCYKFFCIYIYGDNQMKIELYIVLGGILLGLAAGIMLLVRGKILGCSGMLFRSLDLTTFRPNIDNILFITGLFLSGLIFNFIQTVPNPAIIFKTNYWLLFLGGDIGWRRYLSWQWLYQWTWSMWSITLAQTLDNRG